MTDRIITDRMRRIVAERCAFFGVDVDAIANGRDRDRRVSDARCAIAHEFRRLGYTTADTAAAIGIRAHSSVVRLLKLPDPLADAKLSTDQNPLA